MRKVLSLFLTIAFAASFMVVQGQQLKTYHHYQGREDFPGLTYTGYEDELGNITRHGQFTYKNGTKTTILNYKNGKLDGEAIFLNSKPGINCKVKYKDGYWVEINYRQEKYQYYKYNDDMYGKLTGGPIVFKCSRTEQLLPTGDFELTFIAPYEKTSIKGKFDEFGRATGKWTTLERIRGSNASYCGFGEMGDTVYFEQGYCLGNNEKAANLGREFLIEKKITKQELLNKGFFFDKAPLLVDYEKIDGGFRNNQTVETMLYDNLKSFKYHVFCNIQDVSGVVDYRSFVLSDLDDIDFSKSFNGGVLWGEHINFMSNDLYQKMKADPTQLKYDKYLEKYYVVKTDGITKLYVPLDSEEDFNQIMAKKKELEMAKEKENAFIKATTVLQNELDAMVKTNSYNEQLSFLNKFRPVLKYSIEETTVSNSLDKCMITVVLSTKVKSKQPGYFESYKTNVIINKDSRGNWIIDPKQSFVKKERVDNIWDSIANIKNNVDSLDKQLLSYSKECPTVITPYKKENISFNNKESDSKIQYEYYLKAFNVQKAYLQFVDMVKKIDKVSNDIILAAKEESDIVKSYQDLIKSWNLSVNNDIFLEVKRLEDADYYDIQDSCLTFIELRKTITQNNAKIAGYSKTAPTIVKAFNAYMKGVDLSWIPESGRSKAVREIINTQNALISVLSKQNISEIDKTVKKSKAKTWEEVKKVVL